MRNYTALLAALLVGAPAVAQGPDLTKVQIRVERVAPGVAVLFGAGGNIGLSYGEDGNILIDDQFAPLTAKILSAVRSVDADPVRFVINTHSHFDHTGGNENLGKAGAVIIAQDNARVRMSKEEFVSFVNLRVPPVPKVGLPIVTFSRELTLHLNDDALQVVHVPNAHTDGDVLVYWHKAKVLHMGDLFTYKFSLPYIDIGAGGTIDGMIAAIGTALAMVPEDAIIIPGHGPVTGKAELRAYLAMLEDVRSKVAAARAAGRSLDQIKAMKIAAPFDDKGFISADKFIEDVHASLKAATRL